jgi:hypothetical protein
VATGEDATGAGDAASGVVFIVGLVQAESTMRDARTIYLNIDK